MSVGRDQAQMSRRGTGLRGISQGQIWMTTKQVILPTVAALQDLPFKATLKSRKSSLASISRLSRFRIWFVMHACRHAKLKVSLQGHRECMFAVQIILHAIYIFNSSSSL